MGLLGGWDPRTGHVCGSFAHGDRFRPQDLGLWDPFQMAELHDL